MGPPLRPYQAACLAAVSSAWSTHRRILIVAPTGAGKTRIGIELPRACPGPQPRVLWLAHRLELIDQAAQALRGAGHDVACISPKHSPDPWAHVQVASIDTLLARDHRPAADLIIFDEAHHAAAETYSRVFDAYPEAYGAGLTATPQRRDGKPLGDHYDLLIVAAKYSELMREGHIVPCRVARPDEYLGSDLAQEPLDVWRAKSEGALTFAFASTVERAKQWARQFAEAGVASEAIDGNTPDGERERILSEFRSGRIKVLWNVYVLTEGVDVPQASCCLLARGVSHAGPYLQMVGRVLRPAPGKTSATLLDLSGASHLHGFPTQDREYALDGRPIRVVGESLKNCPSCGTCIPSAQPACPECGYIWQVKPKAKPRIWDIELQWAVEQAGGDPAAVGADLKFREWQRLIGEMMARGWSLYFVKKEYERLFGCPPDTLWISGLDRSVKECELQALLAQAQKRGYNHGWVSHRFKESFGHWPRRVSR